MTRKLISSGSSLEKTAGYSRAVVDGGFVFVAGCTGLDYSNNTLPEGAVAQAHQTFANIKWALNEAGASLEDVVRATYYVTDRADTPDLMPVFGEYFGDIRPASTLIICGLVREEMKVEIEVTAKLSTS
jgi:enamine deaminase RidA (YjgF/YER057c/UK114 family)